MDDTERRPAPAAPSAAMEQLAEAAQDYARASASDNTLRAYAQDWADFSRWCRLRAPKLSQSRKGTRFKLRIGTRFSGLKLARRGAAFRWRSRVGPACLSSGAVLEAPALVACF